MQLLVKNEIAFELHEKMVTADLGKAKAKKRISSSLDKFDGSYILEVLSAIYDFIDDETLCPLLFEREVSDRGTGMNGDKPNSCRYDGGALHQGRSLHMDTDDSTMDETTRNVDRNEQEQSLTQWSDARVLEFLLRTQPDDIKAAEQSFRLDMTHELFYCGQVC